MVYLIQLASKGKEENLNMQLSVHKWGSGVDGKLVIPEMIITTKGNPRAVCGLPLLSYNREPVSVCTARVLVSVFDFIPLIRIYLHQLVFGSFFITVQRKLTCSPKVSLAILKFQANYKTWCVPISYPWAYQTKSSCCSIVFIWGLISIWGSYIKTVIRSTFTDFIKRQAA